jgi:hypothetical protein
MKYLKFSIIFLLLLSTISVSYGNDYGNWYAYFGNYRFNKNIALSQEFQYRNNNIRFDLSQVLSRTSINYFMKDKSVMLGAGYAYVLSEPGINTKLTKDNLFQENRIFQDIYLSQKVSNVFITHRYRFEQRFISGNFNHRYRYLLQVNIPFSSDASRNLSKWYFSIYNELFLNGTRNLFDRDRLFVAMGYDINDKLRVQLGNMTQFFIDNRLSHVNFSLHHRLRINRKETN